MKNFFFISALLLLASCSDVHRSKYLEEVDQIQASIDSMETVISEMNFATYDQLKALSKEVEEKVKLLNSDTIPLPLAIEIDQCLNTVKNGEAVEFGVEMLTEELSIASEGVSSLRTDISEDNGHRDRYEEYIQFELEKIEELRGLLDNYSQMFDEVLKTDEVVITSLLTKLDERIAVNEVQ